MEFAGKVVERSGGSFVELIASRQRLGINVSDVDFGVGDAMETEGGVGKRAIVLRQLVFMLGGRHRSFELRKF